MTKESVTDELIKLAKARFNFSASLNASDDFYNALGIDSFQAMELLTDIENHFDIEVPDYELNGVTTFDALGAVIKERV